MNPLDSAVLADENISPEVVMALRERGVAVTTAVEIGLGGASDAALLDWAAPEKRVILTHDVDFGLLTIRLGVPFFGVVFLRPGHVSSAIVLGVIDTLRHADIDVEPPFLVVAERRQNRVLIRVRREESR
jgi:predicted nuclease of predicted toxin-antitoxin system